MPRATARAPWRRWVHGAHAHGAASPFPLYALPAELLEMVVSWLPTEDLMSCRQVDRRLAAAALQFLPLPLHRAVAVGQPAGLQAMMETLAPARLAAALLARDRYADTALERLLFEGGEHGSMLLAFLVHAALRTGVFTEMATGAPPEPAKSADGSGESAGPDGPPPYSSNVLAKLIERGAHPVAIRAFITVVEKLAGRDTLRVLLAPDAKGNTPLHARLRSDELRRFGIDREADAYSELLCLPFRDSLEVRARGQTPLLAAISGSPGTVRVLLLAGADPTAVDPNGRTSLHWAAANGHVDNVKLLLLFGASPTAADENGITPLQTLESSTVYGPISPDIGVLCATILEAAARGDDVRQQLRKCGGQ